MTNKIKGKLVGIGAICIIIISLGMTACAANVPKSDVVGSYKGSWVYNGTQYEVTITLNDAGEYYKVTGIAGSFSMDNGKWNVSGNRINLKSNNARVSNSGYEWKDGNLYSNGNILEKQK